MSAQILLVSQNTLRPEPGLTLQNPICHFDRSRGGPAGGAKWRAESARQPSGDVGANLKLFFAGRRRGAASSRSRSAPPCPKGKVRGLPPVSTGLSRGLGSTLLSAHWPASAPVEMTVFGFAASASRSEHIAREKSLAQTVQNAPQTHRFSMASDDNIYRGTETQLALRAERRSGGAAERRSGGAATRIVTVG